MMWAARYYSTHCSRCSHTCGRSKVRKLDVGCQGLWQARGLRWMPDGKHACQLVKCHLQCIRYEWALSSLCCAMPVACSARAAALECHVSKGLEVAQWQGPVTAPSAATSKVRGMLACPLGSQITHSGTLHLSSAWRHQPDGMQCAPHLMCMQGGGARGCVARFLSRGQGAVARLRLTRDLTGTPCVYAQVCRAS
jgi:hypothetical protein